jgi:hypothetical protein
MTTSRRNVSIGPGSPMECLRLPPLMNGAPSLTACGRRAFGKSARVRDECLCAKSFVLPQGSSPSGPPLISPNET